MATARQGMEVIQAGPMASVQDAGRYGVRRFGITQGGAADLHGWAWANWLVGNPFGSAALEITFGGLKLKATAELVVGLAGADLGATVDGEAVAPWRAFRLGVGQVLAFQAPRDGLRAYLAVAGGFVAERVLGSLSCVVREGLGGHDGRGHALAHGDSLFVGPDAGNAGIEPKTVPTDQRPDYANPGSLDFVLGAQAGEFRGLSLFDFFNRDWIVDSRSDRMGIRLQGPGLSCAMPTMISEGLALGAVQVPPDGQPIVLLNDRQTIGGYPRLGTLSPLACSRLAQCLPGSHIRFRPVPLTRAHNQYVRFLQQFR